MSDRPEKIKTSISEVLLAEAAAISAMVVSGEMVDAVEAILTCKGKLFTTGIGKAGYIAKKAASTFCTTGTPSVFIHPGDATHGDIGVVAKGDSIVAYSNSGRTREVLETVHFCKKLGIAQVIAITGCADSPLGEVSDIILNIGVIKEPCPLGFTPTASTAAMLALSDALALTLMKTRGFNKEDFATRHHGGYLGEQSRK